MQVRVNTVTHDCKDYELTKHFLILNYESGSQLIIPVKKIDEMFVNPWSSSDSN